MPKKKKGGIFNLDYKRGKKPKKEGMFGSIDWGEAKHTRNVKRRAKRKKAKSGWSTSKV